MGAADRQLPGPFSAAYLVFLAWMVFEIQRISQALRFPASLEKQDLPTLGPYSCSTNGGGCCPSKGVCVLQFPTAPTTPWCLTYIPGPCCHLHFQCSSAVVLSLISHTGSLQFASYWVTQSMAIIPAE